MLYLAELNKPNFGKPSLQLLARQPQPDNWQPVNEEAITLEGKAGQDANRFKDGLLVLVDIGPNRQVNRINEAAKQVVGYLQSFGRLQEKSRSQEEEIETWKQSLTFQSQELNRREMEIVSREDELQRLLEQNAHVESEAKALEAKREEMNSLEAHLADQQRIMGQQRELLNEQQTVLSEQQQQLQTLLSQAHQSRLSEAESAQLHQLIDQLQQDLAQHPDPQGLLQPMQGQLQHDLQTLDQTLVQLDEERQEAAQRQLELDQALQSWSDQRQTWLKARSSLDTIRAELHAQEASRRVRHDQIQQLNQQLQQIEESHRCAQRYVQDYEFIVAGEGQGSGQPASPPISLEALLQSVNHLRREYEQKSGQVNQQVAELEQNRQILLDLQQKLTTASASDRFDIEMDIDYAQSACNALEVTLLPQQESVQRDYAELVMQEARLAQLQGQPTAAAPQIPIVDLGPLLAQLDEYRQRILDERGRLEGQIQQMGELLRSQQETLNATQQENDQQWRALEQDEAVLRGRIQAMSETWGRLNHQQQALAQLRGQLIQLHEQTDQIASVLNQQAATVSNSQTQVQAVQAIIATLSLPTNAPPDAVGAILV